MGTCGCRAVPSSMCVHMPVTCMYVHSEGGRPRHLLPFPLRAQGGAGPGPKSHGAPSRPSGQDCASQPSLSPSVRFHRASRLRGEPSLARGPADTQSRGLAGSGGRVALEPGGVWLWSSRNHLRGLRTDRASWKVPTRASLGAEGRVFSCCFGIAPGALLNMGTCRNTRFSSQSQIAGALGTPTVPSHLGHDFKNKTQNKAAPGAAQAASCWRPFSGGLGPAPSGLCVCPMCPFQARAAGSRSSFLPTAQHFREPAPLSPREHPPPPSRLSRPPLRAVQCPQSLTLKPCPAACDCLETGSGKR